MSINYIVNLKRLRLAEVIEQSLGVLLCDFQIIGSTLGQLLEHQK